ncbi:FadR family transcriptional regulator [Pseudomonas sp. GX19020]|uniref:FadR/GntR family transcriptional regulator n=1 Tax=Pseudomonas sp. GX19020 TaxID=2942277 RepID=UPI002019B046|nr:FadR/GntR family transcriptional regulator [Pseudomonas sp. GX19020]MCL4068082.1 FadR family transcriptional regulator [Pseudomonas sp. GX19020]
MSKGTLKFQTEAALRQFIADPSVNVGDRLPTEKDMALEYGVSRTVVREAVAALRADGLIDARHGAGLFVGAKTPQNPAESAFQFKSFPLDVLELRVAVETHACGLAAVRRSFSQEAALWRAAEGFALAVQEDRGVEAADWQFHQLICKATNNHAFVEMFDVFEISLFPKSFMPTSERNKLVTQQSLETSILEHRAICEAIAAGDHDAARRAMQVHLDRILIQFRAFFLSQAAGEPPPGTPG